MILENRVILITGAAGGLGSTAALEFAKQGAVDSSTRNLK